MVLEQTALNLTPLMGAGRVVRVDSRQPTYLEGAEGIMEVGLEEHLTRPEGVLEATVHHLSL